MSNVEQALALVMANPQSARAQANEQLAQARRDRDFASAATALRVLGLAARELQDAPLAARQLRRSIAVASKHGHEHLAGESRMSLALVLDDLGRPHGALREIDRAIISLDGLPLARARMQRGILLRRMGRETEALEAYTAALGSFRRHHDLLWQARALTNRGVLAAYRGGLHQARTDLQRAEELYLKLELTAAVAQVQHNLGFVAAQGGDIVSALDWYERADDHFREHGDRPAVALIDRAELLLAARLLPEAQQVAQEAVEIATKARLGSQLPQARLLLAQIGLASGDRATAHAAAKLARRAFERQQRHRWTVLARYLELRSSTRDNLSRMRELAIELDKAGWPEQSLEAHILLATPVPSRLRRGPARLRIRGWHAEALHRLGNGDTRGAQRALSNGLRLLDQYRAALGATELRVLSSGEGTELAALGIRLALRDQRPRQVLAWAERWRAASLRLRPTPPQDDTELLRDLAQLRRIAMELTVSPSLLRQQRALEDAVRRRTWRTAGSASTVDRLVPVSELVDGLGERALLELIEQDGSLLGIVIADGKVRMRPLTTVAAVMGEVASLRFAMRRLVHRHGSQASLTAAFASAKHSLSLLNEWLIAPVVRYIGDRELVIVPTGALQALPWSAMPGCARRPITIAPSATAWWHAARSPAAGQGTVLIGAHAPEHAIPEVTTLATQLHNPLVLTGMRATAQATLSALDGSHLAHIAAHGAFRSDNPLFSHISLADGPLTGHDLTGLNRAPDLIVLSACETGLSAVHPGDEVMGLTATLLSAGTRTLIASTGPVRDVTTLPLMVSLHLNLSLGIPPMAALVAARRVVEVEDWATAHSFSCFGAGL